MKRFLFLSSFGMLLCSTYCYSQNKLAEIRDISPEEISFEGFRLDRDQEIEIEAVGFHPKRSGHMFTHAWILNAGTRELVWDLEDAATDRRSRKLIDYKDSVRLPEGEYEVYFATFPFHAMQRDGWGNFWERIFEDIFDEKDRSDVYEEFKDELRELNIVVRGKGRHHPKGEIEELHGTFKQDAFVSWTRLKNDENLRQGFRLDRPVEVSIYAIGEMTPKETFDYSWIVNSRTREKVWKMTYRASEHAGGAKKNRVVSDVITLQEGEYVAAFVSDDTHSYDRWNQPPPYDPTFWGMTIRVTDPKMMRYVEIFDYQDLPRSDVIVELTRLRDNEFKTKGFTLTRDLDLHIYALGEGTKKQMADYGWVIDTKTRNKVWQMDFRSTEHAGGASKNRLFDGVIPFREGSYVVYYVTDGSHCYWEWNSAAPHDRESWGITVSAADDRFDPDDVVPYEPVNDRSTLVQLTRIGDHERERARFTLEEDSEVRVYSIGEGKDGKMYDYGWIENANTRRVVWEMTYRMTEHAGGITKNRLYDDVIFLRKGDYIVYYETDGSHSVTHWSGAPPFDPVNWGITLYLVD